MSRSRTLLPPDPAPPTPPAGGFRDKIPLNPNLNPGRNFYLSVLIFHFFYPPKKAAETPPP